MNRFRDWCAFSGLEKKGTIANGDTVYLAHCTCGHHAWGSSAKPAVAAGVARAALRDHCDYGVMYYASYLNQQCHWCGATPADGRHLIWLEPHFDKEVEHKTKWTCADCGRARLAAARAKG